MYTAKKLREEIAELSARCEAIATTGEMTDELRAELDRLQGQGEEGEEGFVPGEIHKKNADLKRMEKIENRTKRIIEKNDKTGASVSQGETDDEPDPADEAKV